MILLLNFLISKFTCCHLGNSNSNPLASHLRLIRGIVALFICYSLLNRVEADVASSTGQINFDTNSDNNYEMTLSSNGLGIGVTSPTQSLEVSGNMIVEPGNVFIGSNSGNSTLNVNGTIGFGIESVSSNVILSGNTIVLTNTVSGNLTIEVPVASTVEGRVYHIKKVSSTHTLYLSGGPFDSLSEISLDTGTSSLPYVSIVSSGGNWHVMSLSGNGEIVSSDNLVGWWKFDEENVSGTAIDSSSGGKNGTYYGSMTNSDVTTGSIGKALDFDGSDDYVSNASFSINGNAAGTLSFWMKTSTNQSLKYPIAIPQASAGTNGFDFYFNGSNNINFFINGSVANNDLGMTGVTYADGNWHHIVGTYDGTTQSLYFDGILKSSATTASGTIEAAAGEINIGRFGAFGAYYTGEVDEVRIYSKSLSASEVNILYQLGQ